MEKQETRGRNGVEVLVEGRGWEGGGRSRSVQQSPQGHTILTNTCQESMSTLGWTTASASSGHPSLLHHPPSVEHHLPP